MIEVFQVPSYKLERRTDLPRHLTFAGDVLDAKLSLLRQKICFSLLKAKKFGDASNLVLKRKPV